jgi:predicted alpha-1,2-mannosidase
VVLVKRVIKFLFYLICILVLVLSAAVAVVFGYYRSVVGAKPGALAVEAQPGELGEWVNPFIGTGGIFYVCAHNFPGPSIPFGMLRLSPETASIYFDKRALNTSGYFYADKKLLGFSHTRLSGTGATDGGHFLVAPVTDAPPHELRLEGQRFRFSHKNEIAFPGYYAVRLSKPKILCELTATERVGVHRYTFPKGETPHLLIDVTNALGGHKSTEGAVRILPEVNEVEGAVRTFGSFGGRFGGLKVYFAARFDQPFSGYGVWTAESFFDNEPEGAGDQLGAELRFKQSDGQQPIGLKLAISHVSVENARRNLAAEAEGHSFDEVLARAKAAWEEKLSLIRVLGGTDEQRTIFYTALYRSLTMPTVFNDVNGEYIGFDKAIHKAEGFRYYTDLSIWDTFRTVHPLFILIAPEEQRDMLVSLVEMGKQGGGWLPRWPSGCGYTNSMLGTPADMVVAESYLKGIRNFDVEAAYQAMRRAALEKTPKGAPFSGREGVEHYLEHGYCPADLMKEAVSRTLEFAYADHAISLLAHELGQEDDAALFAEHAHFYRNVWNPEAQYFQPRDSEGNFVEPFKPLLLTYLDRGGEFTNDYVEGSALQWRWAVPFDAQGLISLFDSPEAFVDELNGFFAEADPTLGAWHPGPYYWHGNEPDLYAAYLFNEAGRPDLTQKWVRWILDNKYEDTYYGLDGNDDAGTLSAWYVFSALGFYPQAGSDRYEIGAPLFERAEVSLGDNQLLIVADNHAPENVYVHEVSLNDMALERRWLSHAELAQGGVLRFRMGSTPLN